MGLLLSIALIRSTETIPLYTSVGTFWEYLSCRPTYEAFYRCYIMASFMHLSLQINPIMIVIMMISTKTLAPKIIQKHHLWGCDPWPLPPVIMQLHRLITKVGGATTTANVCCQIITEQFDKVQLTQKHVESNHAGQNGRLYTLFTC